MKDETLEAVCKELAHDIAEDTELSDCFDAVKDWLRKRCRFYASAYPTAASKDRLPPLYWLMESIRVGQASGLDTPKKWIDALDADYQDQLKKRVAENSTMYGWRAQTVFTRMDDFLNDIEAKHLPVNLGGGAGPQWTEG
jgi:hypothetical protein